MSSQLTCWQRKRQKMLTLQCFVKSIVVAKAKLSAWQESPSPKALIPHWRSSCLSGLVNQYYTQDLDVLNHGHFQTYNHVMKSRNNWLMEWSPMFITAYLAVYSLKTGVDRAPNFSFDLPHKHYRPLLLGRLWHFVFCTDIQNYPNVSVSLMHYYALYNNAQ